MPSIAILLYAEPGSPRDALAEPKYSKLAAHFVEQGFDVDTVNFHDSISEKLSKDLLQYDAILVWVNPVEKGNDRTVLDRMLRTVAAQGPLVSAHPDTILSIGTKEILYRTRNEEFGSDVKVYATPVVFKKEFLHDHSGIRILKPYRGNGGNGVVKVDAGNYRQDKIGITHATDGSNERFVTAEELFNEFESYFQQGNMLIDQPWNPNIINGMVRCYLSGGKVAGFGYQEVNALYPVINSVFKKPSQRFYYSEDCGLFYDLKQVMESRWVKRLQEVSGLPDDMLPVIWDADFFINSVNESDAAKKYSLCEINVSSVSPFPDSAVSHIVHETGKRIRGKE